MKRKLAGLAALMLVFMLGASALAVVAPGEDFYYLDTANVLSSEAEGTIYFCNQQLEEKTGAQIVIAALDSIGGEDTYDYAYDLFNAWGVGSENNGVLLLMAVREDDYYTLVGPELEGIFPSSELNRIIDKCLEPEFAKKNYEAGALGFFEAVLDKCCDYYNIDIDMDDARRQAQAYISRGDASAGFGGAQGGGGSYGAPYDVDGHEIRFHERHDPFESLVSGFITLVVILIVVSILFGRGRGGGFWPLIFFGSRSHHHHHHHSYHHHVHHSRPGPRPRSGGFGAGRSSGFGSSAGRSGGGFRGSFGGARGGGGRTFGGGAGRGRR